MTSIANLLRNPFGMRVIAASLLVMVGVSIPSAAILGAEVEEIARGALEDSGKGVPRLEVERELTATTGGFTKVVWSSDGKKLAAYQSGGIWYSDAGNIITVWTADGTLYRELKGEPGWPFTMQSPLAFIDHDRELATPPPLNKHDLVLSVYDIDTAHIVHDVADVPPERGRNAARAFTVTSDESKLAAIALTGPQPVFLYSTESWQKTALPEAPKKDGATARVVAFSRSGRLLAWDRAMINLELYDLVKQQVTTSIKAYSLDQCCEHVDEIAFGPDDESVAISTSILPGKVRSASGEMIDAAADRPVRVFRTSDGAPLADYPDPAYRLSNITWSARPGGPLAFSVGRDTVVLSDPARATDRGRAYWVRPSISSLAFSPDGSRLAIAHRDKITICNVK